MRDVRALRLEGIEERYERYKEKIKNYTIMDDIFMRNVLKEQGCTEYILQVIMNQKNLQVLEQTLQKDYKNLQGRSAILDCVARDERARQFNVEIQGDNEGASPERARYHSCLLDMNILSPREPFTGLPETYIIFITRNDVLRYDRIICHITRKVEEEGKDFGDGSHIIYVNSKKREDTELGKLMHDLHCKESGEMHSKILASRVRELKETEKGVSEMCRDMEEIYGEGMEEGERKKARETVLSLAELKMSEEQISQIVKMPLEVVQGWIEESLAI